MDRKCLRRSQWQPQSRKRHVVKLARWEDCTKIVKLARWEDCIKIVTLARLQDCTKIESDASDEILQTDSRSQFLQTNSLLFPNPCEDIYATTMVKRLISLPLMVVLAEEWGEGARIHKTLPVQLAIVENLTPKNTQN